MQLVRLTHVTALQMPLSRDRGLRLATEMSALRASGGSWVTPGYRYVCPTGIRGIVSYAWLQICLPYGHQS